MPHYAIEARSLDLAVVVGHDFWVLRGRNGRTLAELHGLATDRRTGTAVPIGTDETRHALRIWHFVHDRAYAASLKVVATDRTYIRLAQARATVFEGAGEEALARWAAALAAMPALNALDLDYPSYGIAVAGPTVNSNAAYRTLGEIMGLEVPTFAGVFEPGVDNRMVPAARIAALRARDYGPARPPAPVARVEPADRERRLFDQVVAAVERFEASRGRSPDARSACMAAALTVLARERGLTRVDHVVLDTTQACETAMLVQGALDDPARLTARMDAGRARNTPLHESVLAFEQPERSLAAAHASRTSLRIVDAATADEPAAI
jgi:hypothetical protein